jgi:hypothetical protein
MHAYVWACTMSHQPSAKLQSPHLIGQERDNVQHCQIPFRRTDNWVRSNHTTTSKRILNTLNETCGPAPVHPCHFTWSYQRPNIKLCGGKPVGNHLSYSTTVYDTQQSEYITKSIHDLIHLKTVILFSHNKWTLQYKNEHIWDILCSLCNISLSPAR